MRRFILTYQREGHSMEIEGVEFTTKSVVLELYPDNDDLPASRAFRDFLQMKRVISEFGDCSIKWLDDENS